MSNNISALATYDENYYNDRIEDISDFIIYYYLYSDIVKFDFENPEENSFVSFLESDDIVIYSLIIKTDCNYLGQYFLNNILGLRNATNMILEKNIISPIIDVIYEILSLFRYWFVNLSEGDYLKDKILHNSEKISGSISIFFVILKRMGNTYSSYFEGLSRIEDLLQKEPFNHFSFDKDEEKTSLRSNLNVSDFVYELIRQILEDLILNVIDFQNIAKKDFFKVLYNKNHEPQIALLLTYFKLFKNINNRLFELNSRFTEYYYKGVLMFKNLPERKDKSLIMLTLNDSGKSRIISKGTNIYGIDEDSKEDVVFKTLNTVRVDSTKIKTIRTIFRSELFINKYDSSLSMVYKIAEYLMDDVYKNNKLLYLFSKKRENDVNFLSTNRNSLGYFFTSDIFNLKAGDRKIVFYFTLCDKDVEKLLDVLRSTINFENSDIELLNKFVNSLEKSFKVIYTSSDSVVEVPNNNISLKLLEGKIIVLEINLTSDMPEFCCPNEGVINENVYKMPGIKILSSDKKHFWAFYFFINLKFSKIDIKINVSNYVNVILQNDIGVLDNNTSSQLFGPFPKLHSCFYLSSYEIINKKLSSLKFVIRWNDLPRDGFKQYYDSYKCGIDNKSFKVSISFLNRNKWIPIKEDERQIVDLFSEVDGNLSDESVIEVDIDRLKLSEFVVFNKDSEYLSSSTVGGFFKIELISPDVAFGHNLYIELLTKSLSDKKNKESKDKVGFGFNDPYTPLFKQISLDYSSNIEISDNTFGKFKVFKIYPFGYFENNIIEDPYKNVDSEENVLNNINTSTICIELLDVARNVINLYFVIDEISVKNFGRKINFKIGYIYKNKCVFLKDREILEDKTYGFTKSGNIKLKIPVIDTANTYFDTIYDNSIWIEIWFFENRDDIPTILGIYYNCVDVIRESKFDGNLLRPLSLKSFLDDNLKDVSVFQPFKSYGGALQESNEDMYRRIKNRLQIKNRCVSIDDYSIFILENFSEVRMVEVVEDTDFINENDDRLCKNIPGSVTFVVILKTNEYQGEGRFFPEASADLLNRIKSKLTEYSSSFADIKIINPIYEQLKVVIRVRFSDNVDENICLKKLNLEISKFIAPWLFDKNADICIAKQLSVIDFIIFLKSKSYIKHILNFHILKTHKDEVICTYGFNDVIYPDSNYSIFISAKKHEIIVVDDTYEDFNNDISIENAHIEEDLIINAKMNKKDKVESNLSIRAKESLNDYFLIFK